MTQEGKAISATPDPTVPPPVPVPASEPPSTVDPTGEAPPSPGPDGEASPDPSLRGEVLPGRGSAAEVPPVGEEGPGTGLARYRRRRRVRVAAGMAVATLTVTVAVAAALGLGGAEVPVPAAVGMPPATDRVTSATLTQTERVGGRLDYGPIAMVVARASAATSPAATGTGGSGGGASGGSGGGGAGAPGGKAGGAGAPGGKAGPGTLTWLPPVGAVVRPGQAVYRVDDRPVVLLSGRLPLWRVLAPGVEGPDAALLEANLNRLGYTGFTVDSAYTAATAWAVRRWQRDLGRPRTGQVDVDHVVVARGAIRVTEHKAALGAEAVGEVLAYTGTTRMVVVPLEVARQHLVRVGRRARVTLPDGRTITGRVTRVGTVASTAGDAQQEAEAQPGQQATGATVEVIVAVDDQAALGRLDAAPVQLLLVVAQRRNVLAVPVGALLALAEGGYGVQVVEGSTSRYVAVETGMFAAGRVEVSGAGIREGTVVGVPA
jgi:hypothetical protein